jgi:hypothetical protein
VTLPYIIINDKQIPFVQSVVTIKSSKTTVVSCLTENEDDTNEVFDLLNAFSHTKGYNFAFEVMNDDGKRLEFLGIISFIVKDRYAINFTIEPISPVRIK